ncbi:hypothetical protein J2T31_003257, partial [Kerstersia gyiorum]|nr:hypothetical protein [Kerstersia gyiorum]MCW2451985.1 hypothetical protein [Kerstersia gyiorum]
MSRPASSFVVLPAALPAVLPTVLPDALTAVPFSAPASVPPSIPSRVPPADLKRKSGHLSQRGVVLSRNAQPVRPVPRCQSGAQARLRYRVLPSSASWLHAPSALDDYGAAGAADANSPTDADGHWKD